MDEPKLRPRTWCALVFAALAVCLCALLAPTPCRGTPPIVGHFGKQIYDPDWPEVQQILTNKCLNCHRPNAQQTDLSTHEALLASHDGENRPMVVRGDPESSLFWEYVCWNAQETPDSPLPDRPEMPLKKSEWLSAGQLDAVFRWIQRGAKVYATERPCEGRPITELEYPSARICAGCHPKQFREWSRSMHAYAQRSPVFEAFNLTLVERTSGTIGTFCSRCHTPIGTALGENESRRNVHRSRVSLEGVSCVVCHRRSTAHYKNNGRFPIEPGRLNDSCMYGPFESSFSSQNGSHGSQKLPYIKSSQFCGECHDVVSPDGIRNEEAFSEWQRSPSAKRGVTCQQCHMGPVQGVAIADCERPLGRAATVPGVPAEDLPLRRLTDHTFAGPDYSLLPDTEFPQRLDWMYETDYRNSSNLTTHQKVTLRNLRLRNRASLREAVAKRYELLGNAARLKVRHPNSATRGQRVGIHVDVESLVAGHNFPTGFTAERQVWVAIEVCDPDGQLVFSSGDLDRNQDLRDEHSHAVLRGRLPRDRFLLNFQNQFTALTNKGTERTVVVSVNRHLSPISFLRPSTTPTTSFGRAPTFRIAKGSLPPLKTMGRTYPIHPRSTGAYSVDVRLQFRHLPPTLLDQIGTPHLKRLLEIVVIDSYQGTFCVKD